MLIDLINRNMRIKNIRIGLLHNMEHYEFAGHVLTMAREANIKKINPLLPELERAIAAEQKALAPPVKLEGTEDVVRLDKERDKAYKALKMMIKVKLLDADKNIVAAAERLNDVLRKYPRAAVENYSQESGMIHGLVKNFRSDERAADVALTGIMPAVIRLDKANEEFGRCYLERYKKNVMPGTFNMKSLRADVDNVLRAIVRRMDSLDDLEPDTPGLTGLITEYNAVIDGWLILLARRRGTNRAARERKLDGYAAMLAPLIPELEAELGLSAGSLVFGREVVGGARRRHYRLVSSSGQIWVLIKKGRLVVDNP